MQEKRKENEHSITDDFDRLGDKWVTYIDHALGLLVVVWNRKRSCLPTHVRTHPPSQWVWDCIHLASVSVIKQHLGSLLDKYIYNMRKMHVGNTME
jgi:hypothetical protein